MNAIAELTFAVLLRGTWVMTGVLLVVLLLRKRAPLVASALLRGTIACLLLLPALIATLPAFRVPLLSPVATHTEVAVRPPSVHATPAPVISTDPIQADLTRPPDYAEPVGPATSTSTSEHEAQPRTAAVTAESRSTQFSWTLLLIGLYVVGTTIVAVRLLVGLWLVRRLRQGAVVTDSDWRESLRSCRMRLGVARNVSLLTNGSTSVPMTIGWMKPSILLPQDVLGSAPIDRAAILLHELAHIRRHDYLWLLMQRLVEVVYWCHPLAWLIGRADRQLREQACDDVCIHWLGSGERYRDTLLAIADRVSSRPRFAIGLAMASASTLSRRVAHILQSSGSARCVSGRSARLTVAGSLLAIAPLLALVQFVPRSSHALAADDQPVDQPPPSEADAEEPGAVTTVFRVISADGSLIEQGSASVRGYTRAGSYFEQDLEISEGSVDVPVPSSHLERLILVISAAGHLSHYKTFERVPGEPAYVVLPEYEFTLQPGHIIGGRLINEAGEPISGATLYLHGGFDNDQEQGFDAFEESVTTDADGRWVSTQAADPANVIMFVEHDQYVAHGETQYVAHGETIGRTQADAERLRSFNDVRILIAAPTLSGTVVDPDGRPVAGAMMLLNNSDLFNPPEEQIPVTDENGSFHFANIRQGEHKLTVFSPDWAMETVTVKIPATEPLRITLHKGSRVEFRAVNPEGEPIEGMHFRPDGIYVYDFLSEQGLFKNTTNADGIVVWENAPREQLSYQIIKTGYVAIRRQEFGPEGSPHTLTFEHAIPVELTVLDADTGEQLTEYKLYEGSHYKTNRPEYWEWQFLRPRSLRHENGAWTQRNGADANEPDVALSDTNTVVQYRAQVEGYRPGVTGILDAADLIGTTVQAEIRLERNAEFAGRVVRPDGTPAAGANIYLFTQLDGESKTVSIGNGVPDPADAMLVVQCNADGGFSLPPQIDPFICMITDEAGYLELSDVTLFAAEDITLLPWSRVRGEVRLGGEPAEGMKISLLEDTWEYSLFPDLYHYGTALTDASGTYDLPRCLPGGRTLAILYDKETSLGAPAHREYREVELAVGETLTQDFGRDTVDIVGHVVLPENEIDFTRSSVAMWPSPETADEAANSRSTVHDYRAILTPPGDFHIHNVQPTAGTVKIWLLNAGDASWSHVLNIPIIQEMFDGKSATDPIDLGEIRIEDWEE